jgi:hypothetical protein
MSLYNAKKTPNGIRITKFDDDLEVESSYLTSAIACECPAGSRDTCRHRQMLPDFIATKRVGSWWFLDWDNRKWVDPFKKAWRRI